ncbi:hypothetical protein HY251_17655 [bacterium]|nr:hypothetical protein [bacterium]
MRSTHGVAHASAPRGARPRTTGTEDIQPAYFAPVAGPLTGAGARSRAAIPAFEPATTEQPARPAHAIASRLARSLLTRTVVALPRNGRDIPFRARTR